MRTTIDRAEVNDIINVCFLFFVQVCIQEFLRRCLEFGRKTEAALVMPLDFFNLPVIYVRFIF